MTIRIMSGLSGDFDGDSPETLNLLDFPCQVFSEICRAVDAVPELINKLVATQDNTKYKLTVDDMHELKNNHGQTCPCKEVLLEWGRRGMNVQELICALDEIRIERALKVLIKPIPLQLTRDIPSKLKIVEGNTLKLECQARGFPYPRYCWFRSRELLTTNMVGRLEITNVRMNDTGTYICRIHNPLKRQDEILWTSKCSVYVEESPISIPDDSTRPVNPLSIHFKKQPPKTKTVQYSDKIELTLEAIGPPPLSYLWCKDGEIISPTKNNPVLLIQSASYKDNGIYQCTVFNENSECKSNECKLTVYPQNFTDQPVIIRQPTDKQESINGIAVFVVEVQCTRQLFYQWYHNGTIMDSCDKNELRFVVHKRNQEGKYQCLISTDNGGHSVMSRVAVLKVVNNKESAYYATDKLAILIGQSNYHSNNRPLPAVKNDLYQAHEVFSALGYKVVSCLDNSLEELNKVIYLAIDLMRGKYNNKLYVIFYVVGHGFVHAGVTYLTPSMAVEGTEISNCLSLKWVEKTIIQELRPVVFLMLIDICQIEMNHLMPENPATPDHDPVSKGMVIFWAATKGQEALEENNISKGRHHHQTLALGEGWVDISEMRNLRGIFSKALFKILREQPKLHLQDLYKAFNDEFQRPDPSLPLTKGKEQDPMFATNLEEERTLMDPINTQCQEEEYEQRMKKYAQLTYRAPQPSFSIPLLPNDNCWNIHGSFMIKALNVLELQLYEEDRRPADCRQHKVHFYIDAQSVPLRTRPCECYRYDDDPELGIRQKRGYLFYNIQELDSALCFILCIEFIPSSLRKPFQVQVNAGWPLISRIWSMSKASNKHVPTDANRKACEHSVSGENES